MADFFNSTPPWSPLSSSMSKAERVLGPADAVGNIWHPNKMDTCPRRRLQKRLSLTSLKNFGQKHTWPGDNAHSRTSSPVQGTPEPDNVNSGNGKTVHLSSSLSTLRAFYNPSTSPLAISQQTSNSSARDMALRKGYPTIVSPLRTTSLQGDDMIVSEPKPKPDSKTTEPRTRRSPIDFSALFPRSRVTSSPSDALASPISGSDSPLSQGSTPQTASPSRRRWRGWNTKKAVGVREGVPDPEHVRDQAILARNFELVTGKVGLEKRYEVQNWLDDAEMEDEAEFQGEKDGFSSFARRQSNQPQMDKPTSDESDLSVVTLTSTISIEAAQSAITQSTQPSRSSIRRSALKDPSSKSQKPYNDLHNQSVLTLSSSDESDNESKGLSVGRKNSVRFKGDSQSPPGSQNAHSWLATGSAATSISEMPAKRLPLSGHNSALFRMPTTPRSGQSSMPEEWPLKSPIESKTISIPPRDSSKQNNPTLRQSASTLKIHVPPLASSSNRNRMSRIMAVTKEEEKLLEAMREKRASMRQAGVAEGYSFAISQALVSAEPRPKTADASEPHSRSNSSSFFDVSMPFFPNPPSTVAPPAKLPLHLPRATLSIDDIRLHMDSPYAPVIDAKSLLPATLPTPRNSFLLTQQPPVPSTNILQGSAFGGRVSSGRASTTDLMPSPTISQGTSHGLPLTPPPDARDTPQGLLVTGLGVTGVETKPECTRLNSRRESGYPSSGNRAEAEMWQIKPITTGFNILDEAEPCRTGCQAVMPNEEEELARWVVQAII